MNGMMSRHMDIQILEIQNVLSAVNILFSYGHSCSRTMFETCLLWLNMASVADLVD